MYNRLRRNYEIKITEHLQNAIDDEEMSPEEADVVFNQLMEDWEAGYGDAMYDLRGDR